LPSADSHNRELPDEELDPSLVHPMTVMSIMGLPVFAMAPDQYETLRARKEAERLRQRAILTSPNRQWDDTEDRYPGIHRPWLPQFMSPDPTNRLSDASLQRRIAIDVGVVSGTGDEVPGDQNGTTERTW